jgi:hypothetical protein
MHAASHVGVGLGNPRAPCQTTPSQVTPYSVGSLRGARCHRLVAGESAQTMPNHTLCAIPGEARCAGAGVTPRGLASLAVGRVILTYLVLWPGRGRLSMTCACGPRSILAQWPV